jgi:prephenate dehydrogenase
MIVTVVGLGLIGGSMALDLKASGFASTVLGVDSNPLNQKTAAKLGIIDHTENIKTAIQKSDLVIVSIPVNQSGKVITEILDLCNEQTIIDVGSTKNELAKLLQSHPKRSNYVATHPIAGTEFSGPIAAQKNLFNNKVTIICDKELSSEKAYDLTTSMYESLGMNFIFMSSKDHDIHSAYVSHISHISSFSLALSVMDKEKDEKNILNMAGSGFESTVRLAKSNHKMWTPIFIENKKNIIEVLNNYIQQLQYFKDAIINENEDDLSSLIKEANGIKKILDNK